ncbi:MAG: N-acetylgalactosamine-6-sulfatase [Planctomycetota bacterium]|nr:MAG: N-acetylgalactosamine-6-sulfatase [Planctomycetota bacterium]
MLRPLLLLGALLAWTPALRATTPAVAGPAPVPVAAPAVLQRAWLDEPRVPAPRAERQPDNVLLIIGDDFAREAMAIYGVGENPAHTPVLDAIAGAGVVFENAYSQMVCSPTRAAMLTGRHAARTGIGTSVPWKQCQTSNNGCFELDLNESVTLPMALRGTHRSGAFGKWHLSTYRDGRGWMHPIDAGFDWFLGAKQNLGGSAADPQVYFEWEKNVASRDGAHQFTARNYATTDNVDDALQFIERQGQQPWFTWLAFNAAHTPFHAPPAELQPLTQATPESPNSELQRAMIEAMDTEIGRLLTTLRPAVLKRTWVIFLADNGPPPSSLPLPLPAVVKAKPNPWEANIHVPMIVAGPGLVAPGRGVEHLVHVVDVYATVCELAGRPVPESASDSVSFVDYLVDPSAPARRGVSFSERHRPNGFGPYTLEQWAVTDGRWKLGKYGAGGISPGGGGGPLTGLSFYDLLNDPDETIDLLNGPPLSPEQESALQALLDERDAILAARE